MRPQEIRRNINLSFKRYAKRNTFLHFSNCKKHLELRLAWHLKNGEDGDTMYMQDIEDLHKINSHVEHMHDRWDCVGRIKFLLEVIKKEY
jgi:hypothetical protein